MNPKNPAGYHYIFVCAHQDCFSPALKAHSLPLCSDSFCFHSQIHFHQSRPASPAQKSTDLHRGAQGELTLSLTKSQVRSPYEAFGSRMVRHLCAPQKSPAHSERSQVEG